MSAHLVVQLVDTDAAVVALARRLDGEARIALDTEFHAEHRYRPDLMLVQLAVDDEAWVVDPRACDLRPLAGPFGRTEVVLHSGGTDLDLAQRAFGARPTRVFDTQRAAGLLPGIGYPARLEVIAEALLGTHMEKAASMTDWSLRPLTPTQLGYAAEDATVLLPLARAIEARLNENGRLEWARTAGAELLHETAGDDWDWDWRWMDIAPNLSGEERKVFDALVGWRDSEARHRNQPPRAVLSDAMALDLARRRPRSAAEVAENRRFPSGMVKRLGAALAQVVTSALADPRPPPEVPGTDQIRLARAIEGWAAAFEADTGIAATLAVPRMLAREVALRGADAVTGWRAEAVRPDLADFLDGRSAMTVSGRRLRLRPPARVHA